MKFNFTSTNVLMKTTKNLLFIATIALLLSSCISYSPYGYMRRNYGPPPQRYYQVQPRYYSQGPQYQYNRRPNNEYNNRRRYRRHNR
jgi:hypothetical protein